MKVALEAVIAAGGPDGPLVAPTREKVTALEADVAKFGKQADKTGGAAAAHRINNARSKFAEKEALRKQRAEKGKADAAKRIDADLEAIRQAQEELELRRATLIEAHQESLKARDDYHAARDTFAQAVESKLLAKVSSGDVHLPDADISDTEEATTPGAKDPQELYNRTTQVTLDDLPEVKEKPEEPIFAALTAMWHRLGPVDIAYVIPPCTYNQLGATEEAVKLLVGQKVWTGLYAEDTVDADEILPHQLVQLVKVALDRAHFAITVNEELKKQATESMAEARTTQKRARLALI
jgi:hypothetical protein